MGFSFHDETSFVEAVGSLRFVAENNAEDESYPNHIPGMVNISQERRDDNISLSDDMQILGK
jgi:hypothetical protein